MESLRKFITFIIQECRGDSWARTRELCDPRLRAYTDEIDPERELIDEARLLYVCRMYADVHRVHRVQWPIEFMDDEFTRYVEHLLSHMLERSGRSSGTGAASQELRTLAARIGRWDDSANRRIPFWDSDNRPNAAGQRPDPQMLVAQIDAYCARNKTQ